jgi:ATP-binding cassette, subfamily B, bacterial
VRATTRRVAAVTALIVHAAPGSLIGYTVLTLTMGAVPVLTAWLTKLLLDNLVRGAGAGVVLGLGGCLAAAGVAVAVLPQLMRYVQTQLDRETGLVAQDRLFAAVDGFAGLGRFENPRFLDRLRLAQQAAPLVAGQSVAGVLGIGQATITVAGFVGSLFVVSPMMAALVLGSAMPTLLAEVSLSKRRARMLWDIGPVERREFFYTSLLSSVEAAKEVRLFGIGGFLRGRMLTERRTANAARYTMDRRETGVQATLGLLAAVVSAGGLLWAVDAARSGTLSIGGVTMFVAAVAGMQNALATLARTVAKAHETLLTFDHYVAVTTAGPDLPIAARPRALPPLRHGIELRDVWFRYSDEHPWVLRGVSLRIPAGQAVAVVGLNGAGKSTLIKLLCRFYDPTRGAILWDGIDLRDVAVSDLRERIGAVFQDYMNYDLTAAENIALGDLRARDDQRRIEAAAVRAGIHHKLSQLPNGYDTLLSRMFFAESEKDDPGTGVVLSGGQWQRLALARAFLRDQRDLMILDEPSAGLDAEAEHDIHASLRAHRAGRTSLLISHRLGCVRDADLIVVLGDGQVVEQGNHRALIASGGRYAELFAMQASGYRSDVAQPAGT